LSRETDVVDAENQRKIRSIERGATIDSFRDWGTATGGVLAIPVGISEWFVPELIPLVLPDPLTGFTLFLAGIGMLYGPRAYRKAIDVAKRMED
jgi:hypothetical protein